MVICLERGADLHMAQLMPLPLTVSCFSKIQIGFAFLVLAHPGSPGQRVCVCVCVCVCVALKSPNWQMDGSYFMNNWGYDIILISCDWLHRVIPYCLGMGKLPQISPKI